MDIWWFLSYCDFTWILIQSQKISKCSFFLALLSIILASFSEKKLFPKLCFHKLMYIIYNGLLGNLYFTFFPCTWVWICTCFSWVTFYKKLDRFMHILVYCSERNKFCLSLAVEKTQKGNNCQSRQWKLFCFLFRQKKDWKYLESKKCFVSLELFWFLRHFTFRHLKKYIWNTFQS